MSIKLVSAALCAAVMGVSSAQAQTVSQIGGPKELPPAGYASMQYIDSRGCVFLRAGTGGNVTWVPRVGQDRKVLCGYPPTVGGGGVAVAAAAAPEVVAKPVRPAAVAQTRVPLADYVPPPARVGKVIPTQPMPVASAAARPLVVAVAPGRSVEAVAGRVGCPASAPRLQRLALTNGGTVLVCTPGNGELRQLRPPIFSADAGVGAALDDAPVTAASERAGSRQAPLGQAAATGRAVMDVQVAASVVRPPEGYAAAWDDDRLNPLRGVGTVQGQAMQDQVWTRKVPATLVADTRKARRERAAAVPVLSVSSKSASPEAASNRAVLPEAARQGGYYVQAGSFGVAANAEGALALLGAAGLPVARSRANGLTLVLAGPFGSAGEAAAARGVVRAAGFGDAFVR